MPSNFLPQPKTRLRIGVIGCGAMGRNHARIYYELKGVELTALVDINETNLNDVGANFDCLQFTDYQDIINSVDAVSIAVPTKLHLEIAKYFLENGIPVLLEKPLAVNENECKQLVKIAEETSLPFLVGHTERFNPAFIQLQSILNKTDKFLALDIKRLNYASSRVSDVDVVMDLMIHDIDIVLALLKDDPINSIKASGYRQKNNGFDYVSALLTSESGRIINLTASRITPNKIREVHVTTEKGHIVMDLIDQKIMIYREGRISVYDDIPNPHYNIELGVEKAVVRHQEPLANELKHFVECVRGLSLSAVSAKSGLQAVEMAYKIKNEAEANLKLKPSKIS